MHHEVLLLSLLLISSASATPSLWSVHIDNGPTPPLENVPPFSRSAIRDRAALKWQIPTLIVSYLTFVLLTLAFILTIGRRLRLEAIDNRDARPMEMVKEPKRTFDPSPVSPKSATSWRKIKGFVTSSPDKLAPPSHTAFDERVIRADREEQSRALQRMYATVYEEEQGTRVGSDPVKSNWQGALQHSENWQQLDHQESKESFAVSLPGRRWSAGIEPATPIEPSQDDEHLPADLDSIPSAPVADMQPSITHRQPSPARNRLASRSSRNLRALRITTSSNPSLAPTPTSAIQHSAFSSRALTPLTPLRSHPTTPAPVQAQTITVPSNSTNTIRLVPPHLHTTAEARTPGTASTYISESAQDDAHGDYDRAGESWAPPLPPAHGGGGGIARTSMDPYLDRPLPPLPLDAGTQAQVQAQMQGQVQAQAQAHAQPLNLDRDLPLPPAPREAELEYGYDTTSPLSALRPALHPRPDPASAITLPPDTATTTALDLRETHTGLPATPRSPFFIRRGDAGTQPPTPRLSQPSSTHHLQIQMQTQTQTQAQPQPRPRPLPLRTFQPPPLSTPASQPATSNPISPPVTNNHGLTHLPLRSPAVTRPTQLTLLSPLSSRFARNGPPTAGLRSPRTAGLGLPPPTPYSPYMPQTPMTPVTPGLQTREERRRQQREERGGGRSGGWRGRRAMGREDVVLDEGEMWGGEYEE